jgi:hypothetical protein
MTHRIFLAGSVGRFCEKIIDLRVASLMKPEGQMRFCAYIIILMAACWPAYRALAEINSFWRGDHNVVAVAVSIVGSASYVLVQHGKSLVRLLLWASRFLTVTLRRVSRVFEKVLLSWDNFFPTIDRLSERQRVSPKSVDPIKESASTSTRPTFSWPVGVTLACAIALVVAVISVGQFNTDSMGTTNSARDVDAILRRNAKEIPATFADRFSVPGCGGCGGPEIDLVPLPKPNPLLWNIPIPRPRPK